MNIDDLKLKQHYDRAVSLVTGVPEDLRPVSALLDSWHWFKLAEGEDSPRVHEIVRLLADQQLRSALKSWYLRQRPTNNAVDEYRRILERAAGEELPFGKDDVFGGQHFQPVASDRDYLHLWSQELLGANSLTLKSKITVVGERNQHLGPRWETAKVQISVEPASDFEASDSAPASEEARKAGYVDWAVFGLLDVFMVSESAPLKSIRIIIEKIEAHPVNSSQMAFRHAGRDAGRKVIESLRQTLFK